ncbi:cupredoxin domain-containing protein [Paracoccus caeni]|uniref:Cupredoxin domain-containing protein n=1 Tax=Paracoccus caeni TaxID=657651 RepID=A0A934VZS3_9RHOB|nr:cupredoxin domain-containing protein [Paracoccus caeni]MBK4215598.1 cupredoxin domain-containing protein [Paracoccus caeni]
MTLRHMNRREVIAAGVLLVASADAVRAHNGTIHVKIKDLAFSPQEIEARPGEIIEWSNEDRMAHTATVRGGWEVMIPVGAKATHVVQAGDNVDYYCRLHPNMTGRIKVIG